ncbi:hypothetical protein [Rhizobium tubonense]|uniref:hypothetical protein n=1 Tax=Rhizobium tubonense TaxID=484088 RepID=UPI0011B4DCFB|nr:hypothetical protein [Rhizobium tubonense]
MGTVEEVARATWLLQLAIVKRVQGSSEISTQWRLDGSDAKLLPHLLVEKYPDLADVQRELQGVFDTCRLAVKRKSISPVLAQAAISLANEYRVKISKLKH